MAKEKGYFPNEKSIAIKGGVFSERKLLTRRNVITGGLALGSAVATGADGLLASYRWFRIKEELEKSYPNYTEKKINEAHKLINEYKVGRCEEVVLPEKLHEVKKAANLVSQHDIFIIEKNKRLTTEEDRIKSDFVVSLVAPTLIVAGRGLIEAYEMVRNTGKVL